VRKSIIVGATLTFLTCAGLTCAGAALAATPKGPPPSKAEVQARRTAEALYAQALRQVEADDFEGGRVSLDAALKQDATNDTARYFRVLVLSRLRETDAALADLALLEPRIERDRFLETKAETLLEGGRYREATAVYDDLIALKPKSADAYRRRAHVRQASEVDSEMPAALADYAKALELDPDMVAVYGLRGEILSAQRNDKAVEENYQAWLAHAPNSARAHSGYAGALARLGKTDKARAEIDRALALEPNAEAYIIRARITPKDQREAFLADIDKALALSSDDTFAYELRAERRRVWGQGDLAMADTEKALEAWPESYSARHLRSTLNQEAGRYDLALKDLDVLIAREPDQAGLYNDRCWARGLGNIELDKALADCEMALKLSPGNAAILDSRGFVKLRQGNLAGAIADYSAALKTAPDQAASLFGRGLAKRRQGAKAAGDLDLAAARKAQPDIDKEFAGYGVTP
jgi:tetratricopeptide (TPR) repeat protein